MAEEPLQDDCQRLAQLSASRVASRLLYWPQSQPLRQLWKSYELNGVGGAAQGWSSDFSAFPFLEQGEVVHGGNTPPGLLCSSSFPVCPPICSHRLFPGIYKEGAFNAA